MEVLDSKYILQRLVMVVFTLEIQIVVVTDIEDMLNINIMTTVRFAVAGSSGCVSTGSGRMGWAQILHQAYSTYRVKIQQLIFHF